MRRNRDLRGALAHFDRAIAIEPRNIAAHNNRGTLKDLGDFDAAIDDDDDDETQ